MLTSILMQINVILTLGYTFAQSDIFPNYEEVTLKGQQGTCFLKKKFANAADCQQN